MIVNITPTMDNRAVNKFSALDFPIQALSIISTKRLNNNCLVEMRTARYAYMRLLDAGYDKNFAYNLIYCESL